MSTISAIQLGGLMTAACFQLVTGNFGVSFDGSQSAQEAFDQIASQERASATRLRPGVAAPRQTGLSLLDTGSPSADMPASLLRELFPKPQMAGQHWEAGTDPVVDDMASGADASFATSVLPMVHQLPKLSVSHADDLPAFCAEDVRRICPANVKSPIHCLGQHQHQVQNVCLREIEKSVPFRCSKYIDQFCDLLNGGVLECLNDHIAEVDPRCKDSVLVTRRVVAKSKKDNAISADGISKAVIGKQKKVADFGAAQWSRNGATQLRWFNLAIVLMIIVLVLVFTPMIRSRFARETQPLLKKANHGEPNSQQQFYGGEACA